MDIQQVKEEVKKHPKMIGDFRRETTSLKNTIKVHWMLYRHRHTGISGASVGDGRIYALKLESTEGGPKVLTPDASKVLA